MEPWDTIPVSWYRLASSASLEPSSAHRHIVYRLGNLFTIQRQPSGEIVATTPAERRWVVREELGQIFVWYGPDGVPPGEFPDWAAFSALPVRRQWTLHVGAPLCIIDENSVDTAHFPVVHARSINASTMATKVDERGRLVITSRMEAYGAAKIDHQIVSTLHSPSSVLVSVRFLGLAPVMIGMFTPIDERHTEMCFVGASRRYLGLGWVVNRLFFERLGAELRGDVPVWEKVRYRERPLLVDGDGAIALYRKWYKGFFPSVWAEKHRPPARATTGLADLVAGGV